LILSVFESKFDQKYENKHDIDVIRPYPIRFHSYSHGHTRRRLKAIHGLRNWERAAMAIGTVARDRQRWTVAQRRRRRRHKAARHHRSL
jgi:hypothetical protein